MRRVYFIDHYDSFSFNLLDWAKQALPSCELVRVVFDDPISMRQVLDVDAPLIISPGPNHPKDVTQTLELVGKKLGHVPIFGICLGHQILAYVNGMRIKKSSLTFHGSKRKVHFKNSSGVFSSMEGTYEFATYNSLCVDGSSSTRGVVAVNDNNEIEALEFNFGKFAAIGVQFHPESFLSRNKKDLQAIWKSMVDDFYSVNRLSTDRKI